MDKPMFRGSVTKSHFVFIFQKKILGVEPVTAQLCGLRWWYWALLALLASLLLSH